MNYSFTDFVPSDLQIQPLLISGQDSVLFANHAYLLVQINDSILNLFEIKYEQHCSPFRQALITNQLLAVGYEEHFYLYDLPANRNLLSLKLEGYFGHLYAEADFFYIADACGIYCIDQDASVRWHNNNLGIDGVIINAFSETTISGSGEWDPPGGWREFVLDRFTGVPAG